MRIGIITDSIDQKGTGSGTSFRRLIRHMLEKNPGHEVFLIHNDPAPDEPLYHKAIEIILPSFALKKNLAIRNLKLDIIHSHGKLLWPFFLMNINKVVTVHGGAELYLKKYGGLKSRMVKKYVRPLNFRFMKCIFTVSHHSQRLLSSKYGIPVNKFVVAHNGVDSQFKKLAPENCKDVLRQFKIKQPFFFHLSRFVPRKNPMVLLEAFSKIQPKDDFQLVIGGMGWQNSQVLNKIHSLGLEQQIKFLGYVPKEHVIKLLNLAFAFVFPSQYGGFGMPNLEAMACGCPVISSAVAAIPEVVGKDGLLVNNPRDPGQLSAKMTKLIASPSLRHDISNRGLKRATQFSWEKSADIVWQTYNQI